MKCLFDRLLTSQVSDSLWISNILGVIDTTRLIQVLSSIDSSSLQGKRVAIGKLPVLEFVCALTFLDGLAKEIVFLPTEDDVKTREARLSMAEIDIVVEDNFFDFTKMLSSSENNGSYYSSQLGAVARNKSIQTKWLLPTSGTTGTPKLISHTFASLTRGMTHHAIGGNYIWASLYSLRRFAGLQVFLQAWMCETPFILTEEGADISDALTSFINGGCNSLSATPSMWRKLAMHPLFDRLNFKQITLGGEIVDQTVLDMLTTQFPASRITQIYASTETGVGFIVRDGIAGFPLEYLLNPPLGIAMRIDNQNHLWFRSTADFSNLTAAESDWIDSGDVVELQSDRVRFLGRANGSINVGGNKVMPEEIESVINELPEVAFVQVRARKSAMLGSLVEASITPMPGIILDGAFKKRVIAHCSYRLAEYKVPAFIVMADTIQLNVTGKLSRNII